MIFLDWTQVVGTVLICLLVIGIALFGGAYFYGQLNADKVLADDARRQAAKHHYPEVTMANTAILIACYKGEGTIATTVSYAKKTGCPVYVVIDGPGDRSAEIAEQAGAEVLALPENGGKPAALWKAYQHFDLSKRFAAVAILDDDVMIESDFIDRALEIFTPEVAIVVGKNITWWPKELRWNVWLAVRAYSYWSYQLITRRVQSWFNVMNCISGSNSVYRTELLDKVLSRPVRYIVDDTQWVLDTHRMKLGRIRYAPRAHAYLQDPTNFKEWYHQNMRWLKGTVQGIIGHKVGRSWTWFDFAYCTLIMHWIVYVMSAPLTAWIVWRAWKANPLILIYAFIGYLIWTAIVAIALRRIELLVLFPAIVIVDYIYRWIFVVATIKAIRQPTVEVCRWDSPTRIAMTTQEMR